MAVSSTADAAKKLAELQSTFKQQLPGKIADIDALWNTLQKADAEQTEFATLHRLTHSLVGAGGTFGAQAIGAFAKELENIFKPLANETELSSALSDEMFQKVKDLLSQLTNAADDWQPSNIPNNTTKPSDKRHDSNLIYLADDDELFAKDLMTKLEVAGYRVQHFVQLSDFESAYEKQKPAAIIMDMVFAESDTAGANLIAKFQQAEELKGSICPPVIFVSVRDDMNARLTAARAGARRYFCKPLDIKPLVQTLNGLTARNTVRPYQVLIVDDDETQLEHYATLLRNAGMDVKTLSKPLDALPLLAELKPDVVILDVYMPECSGPELAQVIRQDDAWAMMPIIFLSGETDLDRQLAAMNFGGDDFLIKPVKPNHFVSTVTAKAKRARWVHRLNKNLNSASREQKFQLAAIDQHNIVSTADTAGRIIEVNDKFCEISGYSREELLGQNHRLVKSNFHPRSFYEDMWNTISQGKVWHGSLCNLNKNGNEYWVASTIVPFLDDAGIPYKYVSARTDITETRQNEERLNRSQLFANIGTWDWNISTGELYWSDRIGHLFGHQNEVLETSYENFLAAVHPDDRQTVIDSVTACVEEGAEYSIEHRVVWPDDSVHWVSESGNVIRSENGQPLHMLGVVQDIDDRKRAEQEIIHAREDAEDANRTKSQFLSSMSHELRTPMNAIMGFGQLLKMETDPALTESQMENVNEIVKAGDHLLELINEVLDLAKIEAGRIDFSIEDVVLGEVISESLQLIMPLAQKRGIEIIISHDGSETTLDQLSQKTNAVRADRTRLRQVLLNLLSNAVKYNNENGKLSINCHYTANNLMRIDITDTGEGITKKQQEQLFTAFNRLGAEQTETEGTGIGLVITKNIIELMGGNIGLESQPGKGSTFWIELPGNTLLSTQKEAMDTADITSLPTELDHEYTVLYIEDNPANLRLVTQLLGQLNNIHMWSAHEPMLGLELAAEHKPDLILLDINLPGIDGFEVLKHLRQRGATRNTPVIAISANAMPRDIEKGLEAGFDEYITKPIDVTALLHAVDTTLSGEST